MSNIGLSARLPRIPMSAISQHNLVVRPPVVVIMGHIDHGKSTLLDYIRKSDIVAGEAGGITQHMGAYQIEHATGDKRSTITFLDTPGHAAFCGIRERGAQAADIAILIVSAEDGVKPQTMEAYEIIKASGIPFVVAITKIDKPNADIQKAKTSLGEHEIYVEGWGGDVPCVEVSSITGAGVPALLDMVMLVADLADLTADPATPASGYVIESALDTRKGVSATLLIKNGTLRTGSFVVAGGSYAPVRFIEDFKGDKMDSAGPSAPVRILGWSEIPECGIEFSTVGSKKEAEQLKIENLKLKIRSHDTSSIFNLQSSMSPKTGPIDDSEDTAPVIVPLVIKADVIGSLEGIIHEIDKISHERVRLKIVSADIGDINENDVKLAVGDPSITVLGFNAPPDKKAQAIIKRSQVPLAIESYTVIYELIGRVKELLISKIPKEYVEEATGRAKVLAVFSKERDKQVVGGKVETGMLETGSEVRILRRETEVGRGKIRELQQAKKRADEVREGFEFGTMIEAKTEIAAGDRIEAVRTIEKSNNSIVY